MDPKVVIFQADLIGYRFQDGLHPEMEVLFQINLCSEDDILV